MTTEFSGVTVVDFISGTDVINFTDIQGAAVQPYTVRADVGGSVLLYGDNVIAYLRAVPTASIASARDVQLVIA